MIKFAAVAGAAGLLLAGSARAQDVRPALSPPGAAPASASLADLKGLIGAWQGTTGSAGFSLTADGLIVGHLELGDGTKPRVEEIWIIRPVGHSVEVNVKHFDASLVAREDKETWSHRKLVAIDAGGIYLENLTWLTQGDTLTLMVRLMGQNGAPPFISTVVMQRVK
ncbi:MAG TPA: DUF6265 family protein [Caulobacteraceae bacterium]|nr:DUF6265 family protein [Caulobacteraceae bacterium]